MRHYFLKPIRPRQTVVTPVLSVSPASLSLDRTSPGNVATFTASLSSDPGSPLAVTVSSSDPSVTVSPATFSLGGGNAVTATVTVTGAAAGPDSASLSVSAPGQTTKSIAIVRPPVPLDLTVSPASLVLDRVSPGNAGSFTVALNRVPDSAVQVSVSSSDTSVTVSPASFSLSTGSPPSRSVALTGAATGPSPVTISVVPVGLSTRTVSVTRTPFTPAVFSGLALWLDGGDAASFTLDGSNNVSQWSDKSGNARHLLQTNATQRPSYTSSNQINGITVPNFDGADDTMVTSGSSTISQANTIYVVFRLGSGAAAPQLFDGSSARQYLYFPSTTSIQAFANSTLTPTIASVVGAATQIGVLFNGASSTIRLNGAQISSGNLGISGIGPEITVGSNRFGGSLFKGQIAELLIYSKALSTTESDNVEAYLKAKWGTP